MRAACLPQGGPSARVHSQLDKRSLPWLRIISCRDVPSASSVFPPVHGMLRSLLSQKKEKDKRERVVDPIQQRTPPAGRSWYFGNNGDASGIQKNRNSGFSIIYLFILFLVSLCRDATSALVNGPGFTRVTNSAHQSDLFPGTATVDPPASDPLCHGWRPINASAWILSFAQFLLLVMIADVRFSAQAKEET